MDDRQFAQIVILKEVTNKVFGTLRFFTFVLLVFLFLAGSFRVVSCRFALSKLFNKQLVPNRHVDVAVEVTSRHFVLLGSFTFTRKDNNIEQMVQLQVSGVVLTNSA